MADSPLPPPPDSAASAPPSSKKPLWKRWWVIAIAAIVVVIVISAIAGGGSDDTDDAATDSTVATVSTETETTAVEVPGAEATVVDSTVVDSTAADSTAAADGDASSLTVESGFTTRLNSIGSQQTTSGAVVTNGSGQSACGIQVQFNLLDAGGATIDTGTETIDFLAAGGNGIVAPLLLGFEKGEPASLNVSVIKVDEFIDGTGVNDCGGFSLLKGIPIEVVSPIINRDGPLSSIEGQLTNTGDELAETSFIDCVYRAAGVLVGGESTASLDPIPPGQSVAFSAGLGFVPDNADAVECQAAA